MRTQRRTSPRLVPAGELDPAGLDRLLGADPVAHAFVAAHVESHRRSSGSRIPPVVGTAGPDGRLTGACWTGTNVVPVALDEQGLDLVAGHLRRGGSRYASIFGPAEPVLGLWSRLERTWPRPFDVRPVQPLLAIDHDPAPAPHPGVRFATTDDLSAVLPASAAMFEEEVGYSPFTGGDRGYRDRVATLVGSGRCLVLTDDRGRVVFKADLGSIARGVAQVQGVWVDPAHRGRGLAVPCMAAAVRLARRSTPVISLYVNDYNTRALATYRRVGFERVGTFATVLL
ncbi:GNAT family N-acetyltransferase [Kocuria sabuli]|uniref:GNAT family N-acetyltransferase n=1 Tax=Kocuria sabuli TaxID=3071448 RepID=UPI0034D66F56